MGKWSEHTVSQLRSKLEGTKENDLRFFRIAEFERMIKRTDDFSKTCAHCQKLKPEIESVVAVIDQAIHIPGPLRSKYDRLIGQMSKHQRKAHGFFPPYFFTYNYSFWGMLAGSLLGFLLGWIILWKAVGYFVLSGFALGLLTAQIWGSIKDRRIRTSGKLL